MHMSGGRVMKRRRFLGALGAGPLIAAAASLHADPQTVTCSPRRLWTLLGDYPHTHALHAGQLKSACVSLDIAPVPVVFTAFARTVAMEFDISELSLVTFLQARSAG